MNRGVGNFFRGENSNRGPGNNGGGIFDDIDEFAENPNGSNNLIFDDDVMADDNNFLSPTNQYFSNTNQGNDLFGINDDSNLDAAFNEVLG